jgi:hypothetical protein
MMRRINFQSVWVMTVTALPLIALSGCVATAPSPYYAAHPSRVVVMPSSEPDTTTHYVYGEVNSTNETHITSNSTVHIISNHPLNGGAPPVVPPSVVVPPAVDEPAPPEEQTPRAEPADETPAEEPAPEPSAEPEAEAPAEPPAVEPAPEPDQSSSSSDNSSSP